MKAFIKVNDTLKNESNDITSVSALDSWLLDHGVIHDVHQLAEDIKWDNVWYFIED